MADHDLGDERSMQMNGLLNSDSGHPIVKGRVYQSNDKVFPFICAFLDNESGCKKDEKVTNMNCLYSKFATKLCERYWSGQGNFNAWMVP